MMRLSILASFSLLLGGCGLWVDVLAPEEPGLDAALADVGEIDVGQFDVGQFDVGQFDVGQFDAGQFDVGAHDGGTRDAGTDAGLDAGNCTSSEDCFALNTVCMVGACVSNACVRVPASDDLVCDDGDACTARDVCASGVCIGELDCSTFDSACSAGICSAGGCMSMPTTEACDDTDVCSWSDACGASAPGMCGGVTTDCGVRTGISPRGPTEVIGRVRMGSAFSDPCPRGQVMVGVQASVSTGFYAGVLRQFSTICGEVLVDLAGVLTIGPGATIPAIGHGSWPHGGRLETASCGRHEVVVGFSGAEGISGDRIGLPDVYLTQLRLRCAPLSATGSIATGFTAVVGAVSDSAPRPTIGASMTRPFGPTDCPAGSVAIGSVGRAGDILDAYGLLCGRVELSLVTTAPPAGSLSSRTVFRDDCPWGSLPVGIRAGVSMPAGLYNRNVTHFQTLCAPLNVGPNGPGMWSVTLGTPSAASTPAWGAAPVIDGSREERQCRPGEVVVGYEGAGDIAVTRVVLHCASITATGPATLVIGPATSSLPFGLRTDRPLGPLYTCPPGMLGRGFYGTANEVVNSLALRCARPWFAAP